MPRELTNKDYISILNYYKLNVPKTKMLIKKNAEKIMAEKLCRCIKKIDTKYEAKSIGICTKSIFNRKGYTRGQFQCKKNQSVKIRKQDNNNNNNKNKNKNKNKTVKKR